MEIGTQKQLLLDEFIVEDTWNLRRAVVQPAKYPANPLMVCDRPWEEFNIPELRGGGPIITSAVLCDEAEGLFKMWYILCRMVYWKGLYDKEYTYWTCYATSPDGRRWEKPELGIVEFEGSRKNNILLQGQWWATCGTVLKEPAEPDPARRYKMLYTDILGKQQVGEHRWTGGESGVCIAYSPDGIHWTPYSGNPVMGGESDTMNTVFWDERLGKYVWYLRPRVYAGYWKRRIARAESADLIHWSFPETVLVPDELDTIEVYGMPVFVHEGVYFGLLQMYDSDKNENITVQLAFSRDGKKWERLPTRDLFLALGGRGETGRDFDSGMVFAAPPVRVGDELWFYYSGWQGTHKGWENESAIGLATSKTDRLIGRRTEVGKEGALLTRSFRCEGDGLEVNVSCANGWIIAEVLGLEGEAIPGYDRGSCLPFSGDAIRQRLGWKEGRTLGQLRGQEIRLKFYLRNAELYAFQVRDSTERNR